MKNNDLNNLTKFEDDESVSMAELMKQDTKTEISKGQILDVVIVAQTDDAFMVDFF